MSLLKQLKKYQSQCNKVLNWFYFKKKLNSFLIIVIVEIWLIILNKKEVIIVGSFILFDKKMRYISSYHLRRSSEKHIGKNQVRIEASA